MAIQITTFKGARYIVKFHDPIEWSAEESYEAIESVKHNAFTYISKQPVPAGVQIDNEDFWLLWADPNAQMEELRRLVSQYVDNVEELSGVVGDLSDELGVEVEARKTADTEINSKFGISFVGNYGAKENDSSIDWQNIIDEIATKSNTIDFGNGQWIINNEISFPINIKNVIGNGAVIKTTEAVTTLFTLNRTNPDYLTDRYIPYVSGINFHCGFNVEKVVSATFSQVKIENCLFKDFNSLGIEITAAGGVINNCDFIISSNGDTFANNTVGCRISTDSKISGCKFFGLHICINTQDNSVISNNYFWIGTLTGLNYCVNGIVANGNDSVSSIIFNNNEIDGYPYVFRNIAGIINNNLILFNGAEIYYQDSWVIFNFTVNSNKALDFSNNTLDFVYGFQHELHTFIGNSNGVFSYTSRNNIVLNSRNEKLNHLFVGFGCASPKYILEAAAHIFTTTASGINISYDELFNYQGKYESYIADAGNQLYMSISNTQNSSAFVLVPSLNKYTDNNELVITNVCRGGAFNNIVSRAANCLFEFLPAVPTDIEASEITFNAARYAVTTA